nr:PREDICTED: cystatin-S-like isoform X1 [Lepisosteus oculatus]
MDPVQDSPSKKENQEAALLPALSAPAGALHDADPDSPEVRDSAAFALYSFNYFNKDPYLYKITTFESVKEKDVGGGEYIMDVLLQKTQCRKKEDTDPQSCLLMTNPQDTKALLCHFVVLNAPWKQERVLIESQCHPRQQGQ